MAVKEILKGLLSRPDVDNFVDYYRLLVENNKKFNLTSVTDERDVCVKHFYDSVCGAPLVPKGAKVIEIGSGGGFPSVPLKLVRDDIDFTLVEATGKKCGFLNGVKEFFRFENFTVVNGRAEELGKQPEFRECFDIAVARAVASLNSLLEYLLPFVKVGGKVICYKGSNYKEELKKAQNAIKALGGRLEKEVPYDLPDGAGSRCLVVIKKISPTSAKYPRTEAKIRKTPL